MKNGPFVGKFERVILPLVMLYEMGMMDTENNDAINYGDPINRM